MRISEPDLVFLHLMNMQQSMAKAMIMRTITTAAALPPSLAGGEGTTIGSVEMVFTGPAVETMGSPLGTAAMEGRMVGGRQTCLPSFKVGMRPLGHEQTVLPSFNVDVKVSGQAHVAVTGLVSKQM